MIRGWLGTSVEAAKNAGSPSPGMTREMMTRYVGFIKNALSNKTTDVGTEIAKARLEKLLEWLAK